LAERVAVFELSGYHVLEDLALGLAVLLACLAFPACFPHVHAWQPQAC